MPLDKIYHEEQNMTHIVFFVQDAKPESNHEEIFFKSEEILKTSLQKCQSPKRAKELYFIFLT